MKEIITEKELSISIRTQIVKLIAVEKGFKLDKSAAFEIARLSAQIANENLEDFIESYCKSKELQNIFTN